MDLTSASAMDSSCPTSRDNALIEQEMSGFNTVPLIARHV